MAMVRFLGKTLGRLACIALALMIVLGPIAVTMVLSTSQSPWLNVMLWLDAFYYIGGFIGFVVFAVHHDSQLIRVKHTESFYDRTTGVTTETISYRYIKRGSPEDPFLQG